MNRDVIWCVVILVVLCVIGATGCRLWLSEYSGLTFVPFLSTLQDPSYESMLTFWTFVIILQVMIPLSLYVTIEMAKVGQVYHIGHDIALFDADTGRPAECRALNITEELGQVSELINATGNFPDLHTGRDGFDSRVPRPVHAGQREAPASNHEIKLHATLPLSLLALHKLISMFRHEDFSVSDLPLHMFLSYTYISF